MATGEKRGRRQRASEGRGTEVTKTSGTTRWFTVTTVKRSSADVKTDPPEAVDYSMGSAEKRNSDSDGHAKKVRPIPGEEKRWDLNFFQGLRRLKSVKKEVQRLSEKLHHAWR